MTEIWRPTHIYPTHYSVSNLGNVRREAQGKGARLNQYLKPFLNHTDDRGRYRVRLVKDGIEKDCYVHILVAQAFLGPCLPGKEVNHKDTNKRNNVLSNLEYLTRSENMQHAFKNGCYPNRKGNNAHHVRLTENEILEIRNLYAQGNVTQGELAKKFSVTQANIHWIVSRKLWKHI